MRPALARVSFGVLWCSVAFGQPTVATPQFEVAEIKVSKSTGQDGKGRFLPSGQVEVPNTTLKELIIVAYGLQENMISGAPPWLDSEHYQLIAKAPPNTGMNTLRLMLRPLLADRFKLAVHTEEKVMPVYALLVGKRTSKLQPAAGAGPQNCRWVPNGAETMQRECHNLSMADLALQLPGWGRAGIDRPVVDLTELKGAYDFTMNWKMPNGGKEGGGAAGAPREPGSTIFEALDQIGLKLEPRKHSMPVICIDHVERLGAGKQ